MTAIRTIENRFSPAWPSSSLSTITSISATDTSPASFSTWQATYCGPTDSKM